MVAAWDAAPASVALLRFGRRDFLGRVLAFVASDRLGDFLRGELLMRAGLQDVAWLRSRHGVRLHGIGHRHLLDTRWKSRERRARERPLMRGQYSAVSGAGVRGKFHSRQPSADSREPAAGSQ